MGYQPNAGYDPNDPNSASQYPPIPPTYEPQSGAYPPPPPPPAPSYPQPGYGQPGYPPPAPPSQPLYGAPGYGQPGYPPPAPPSQPMYAPPSQPMYAPPPYGQPPMQPMGYGAPMYPAPPDRGSGMAVAGLILGIISIPAALAVSACGLVFGVLALIFSIQGRKSLMHRGMATAGIILSSIALGISVLEFVIGAGSYLSTMPH